MLNELLSYLMTDLRCQLGIFIIFLMIVAGSRKDLGRVK